MERHAHRAHEDHRGLVGTGRLVRSHGHLRVRLAVGPDVEPALVPKPDDADCRGLAVTVEEHFLDVREDRPQPVDAGGHLARVEAGERGSENDRQCSPGGQRERQPPRGERGGSAPEEANPAGGVGSARG